MDDTGYLADSDTRWPPRFNTNLVPTHELLNKFPVLVLLGEPGSGKSFEFNLIRSIAKEECKGEVLRKRPPSTVLPVVAQ